MKYVAIDLAAGDIDQDGYPDLLLPAYGSYDYIYFNNAKDLEPSPSWTSLDQAYSSGVALGDVTASGFLSPAIVHTAGCSKLDFMPNHLYGNATGTPPQAPTWQADEGYNSKKNALADYDEDGLFEKTWSFSGTGDRSIFRFGLVPIHSIQSVKVDGTPTTLYSFHPTDGWISFVYPPAAGSNNIEVTVLQSNDLDMAVAYGGAKDKSVLAKIYHHTGSAFEGTASIIFSNSSGSDNGWTIDWVDVDNDGDKDLLVGSWYTSAYLFLNDNGTLQTTPAWTTAAVDYGMHDADCVDMDLDGYPELAIINYRTTPAMVQFYKNTGGMWEDTPSWTMNSTDFGGTAVAVSWGDMDGDGYPDMAIAGAGCTVKVYHNKLGDTTTTPVYRFFNTVRGGHLYTISRIERDYILNNLPHYSYEGIKFHVYKQQMGDSVPVYRFFNTNTGIHLYTISQTERDYILNNLPNYQYEGVKFYVQDEQNTNNTPVYRFFHTVHGGHLYTISQTERDYIINNLPQYNYEGIKFFVFKQPQK